MTDRHPLRPTRRPRRENHIRHIPRPHRPPPLPITHRRRIPPRQIQPIQLHHRPATRPPRGLHPRRHQHQHRIRHPHHIPDPLRRLIRIQRHIPRPRLHHRQHRHHQLHRPPHRQPHHDPAPTPRPINHRANRFTHATNSPYDNDQPRGTHHRHRPRRTPPPPLEQRHQTSPPHHPAPAAPHPLHSRNTRNRSASSNTSISPTGTRRHPPPPPPTPAPTRATNRRTVTSSNRSRRIRQHTADPRRRPIGAVADPTRSTADRTATAPVSTSTPDTDNPGNSNATGAMFWNDNTTWNNGCRAVDRAGFNTSTNRSNGTSACPNAARSDLPHPRQQLRERLPATTSRPQHQRVDEHPDHIIELGLTPPRERRPHRHISVTPTTAPTTPPTPHAPP